MLWTPAWESARADASASLRAVELRGEVPILTLLATRVGWIISSRGEAANAATILIDRIRKGTENMITDCWSCS